VGVAIAGTLSLGKITVKTHIYNAFAKIGVRNRAARIPTRSRPRRKAHVSGCPGPDSATFLRGSQGEL
jgi:hypothetical protein